jgi:hypothetical protein
VFTGMWLPPLLLQAEETMAAKMAMMERTGRGM